MLDDDGLAALNAAGRRRTVPAGQVLMWEGDRSLVCATLVAGVLKIVRSGPDGSTHIVGLLFPGDFVGQVFGGQVFDERASETIQALGEADLCVYPRAALQQACDRQPAVERLLLHRALATLNEARAWMLMLGRKDASAKIATFLIDMARRMGASGPATHQGAVRFDLPMSRSDIGAALALTIETVSRQMTALRCVGIIALPGGRAVEILDRARLQARAAA
ncbi:MAG TPA: Crp/Fnr family transcriptional regulator [Sphingomonas sp.]|nr:Crp/Fnr family transcriptional regulator [Sphingomonas sp.]